MRSMNLRTIQPNSLQGKQAEIFFSFVTPLKSTTYVILSDLLKITPFDARLRFSPYWI